MISLYTIEIRNQYGHYVTTILRPMNREFTVTRNRSGSCQFTLDLFDPQATTDIFKVNLYDIVVKRQGVIVFSGQISYFKPSVDGDNKTVEVMATGYFDLLDYRLISEATPNFDALAQQVPFDPTDSGEIIVELIDGAQFPLNPEDDIDTVAMLTGPTPRYYQSFIAPATSRIKRLRTLVNNHNFITGNVIFTIYEDNNNFPAGAVGNSIISFPASSFPADTPIWFTVNYPDPKPEIIQGNRYWVQVKLDTIQRTS